MKYKILFATFLLVAGLALAAGAAPTLQVLPAAAMDATNFGMRVTLDGVPGNAFVQDQSPNSETVYRATFFIRNGITSAANGDRHQALRMRQSGGGPASRLLFMKPQVGGNHVVILQPYDDSGLPATTCDAPPCAVATFVPNVHQITVEFTAASAPGANDGTGRLYKGANMIGEITGLDNDTLVVDLVDMGAFGGVDATHLGTIDFDEFSSFRTLFVP